MKRHVAALLSIVLVAGLVGCDHATKYVAQTELRGQPPVTLLANILDLRYTENRDVGFSLMRQVKIPERARKPLIFVGSAVGLSLLLALWWRRRRAPWQEHVAYAVILGGALGNLSDRLARGYVVDFVHLNHWPVFNVADICLVVGFGLVFLASRVRHEDPEPSPATA